jgi:hypothetical protein
LRLLNVVKYDAPQRGNLAIIVYRQTGAYEHLYVCGECPCAKNIALPAFIMANTHRDKGADNACTFGM